MANNKHADEIDKLIASYRNSRLKIVRGVAAIALAFFKKSFTDQGFTDKGLKKWKARLGGPRNSGRGVLMDKATLKRGIRIKRADIKAAIIGVDSSIKYADIHNNGGSITITPKMRRFFWAMYYKSGGAEKSTRNNDTAQFYLSLALKKDDKIVIPKRQFIGDSATLDKKLMAFIEKELTKIFKI